MSISAYIKEIGRGKEGARALSQAQAYDLMQQILHNQVTDLELGAFAIAMRIKGESVPELAGFLQAVTAHSLPLQAPQAAVVLPSYNGARKLPNLTPLLAALLAQQDIPVLIHGLPNDTTRVTSAQVFTALGWPLSTCMQEITQAWQAGRPAYIDTEKLCPPLAKLLHVRQVIGLRNPGHTVAKLLDPFEPGRAVRVVNHTHPEYGHLLTEFLQHTQANAMLLRGTEGEPVADARRQPQLQAFLGGQPRADLSTPAQTGILRELPTWPSTCAALATAQYTQAMLQNPHQTPAPLQEQVRSLLNMLAQL